MSLRAVRADLGRRLPPRAAAPPEAWAGSSPTAWVVAAHDRAMATFRGRDRLPGQYRLVATMVCDTVGGIALLVGT